MLHIKEIKLSIRSEIQKLEINKYNMNFMKIRDTEELSCLDGIIFANLTLNISSQLFVLI